MKRIKKIFLIALSSLFLSSIAVTFSHYDVSAEEYVIDTDIPEYDDKYPVNLYSGNVKALAVRVGFSDHPVNNDNPVYSKFSDKYLRLLYEGKKGGFGLPYNGVFDYLHTSSYGKLTMRLEDIIDIQLDGTYESYINKQNDTIAFFRNEEFIEKFYSQIKIAGYDYDQEGDFVYIWPMSGESIGNRVGYTVQGYNPADNTPQCYTVISIPKRFFDDDAVIVDTIIHETGHILGSGDYYESMNYPNPYIRDDTGNIMGWVANGEKSDYDAWTKWIQRWITKENAIGIDPKVGETGKIDLTPYDSDTDAGKKIVLFKCEEGYIAVDYRGGINNNNYDTDLRKKGFRFYKINNQKEIVEIYHKSVLDPNTKKVKSVYHLFAEGDEINDLLYANNSKSLKITNIKTGNNPSFVYTCTENKQEGNTENIEENDTRTGVYYKNGQWIYLENGRHVTSYTGFGKTSEGKWVFVRNGVFDPAYTGLAKNKTNGGWFYAEKGVYKTGYTGIAKSTDGKLYYVKGSKWDKTYTGLVKYTDGKWYYVKNGTHDPAYTGLAKNKTNGGWFYAEKGVYKTGYTGIAKSTDDKLYFVKNSKWDKTYTGLAKYTDGKWYYVKNGAHVPSYTGLTVSTDGKYYYAENGVWNKSYTGYAKNTDGKWYFVRNGVHDPSYTGLAKNKTNGGWFYAEKGIYKTGYTGIAKSTDGKLYYVKGSKWDKSYTGLARYTDGKWYYVKNGSHVPTYTGVTPSTDGKLYYAVNGVWDKTFTGKVKDASGNDINIKNGIVV